MTDLPNYLDTGFVDYIFDGDSINTVKVGTLEAYFEMIDTTWSIEQGDSILPVSYPIRRSYHPTRTLEYWNNLMIDDRFRALEYYIENDSTPIALFLIKNMISTKSYFKRYKRNGQTS